MVTHSTFRVPNHDPPHLVMSSNAQPMQPVLMHSPMWLNVFSFSNRIMLFLKLSLIHGENLTTCAQKLLMPMMASRLMVQVTFIMNLYLHCLLHQTMSFLPSSKDIRLFHLSRSRQPMAHTYSHTYHFLPIIWRHNHLIMGENLICHTGV